MKNELSIKKENSFSLRARLKSFRYAFDGINAFFSSQHNAIIHLMITIFVFIAAVFFNVNREQLISMIIATGFVWTAELFNTAIEKLADMISKDHHPQIKFIKDVSAAGVLLSAI